MNVEQVLANWSDIETESESEENLDLGEETESDDSGENESEEDENTEEELDDENMDDRIVNLRRRGRGRGRGRGKGRGRGRGGYTRGGTTSRMHETNQWKQIKGKSVVYTMIVNNCLHGN